MSDENARLRGALQRIVDDGDFTAPENMKRIAREALSNSPVETNGYSQAYADQMRTALLRIQQEAVVEEVDPDDCRETIARLSHEALMPPRGAVEPSSDSGAALFAVQGENARLREALRGVMECSGTSCRHYHIAHDALQPEKASGELCEGCPPVGYPTDETRCTPCPRRSEKVPRPRVPQNEHEATLTAIRTRDTESVPTWFKEPPLGACGRAFIDRRWLLKEIDTLRADMAQDQQRLFHLESALAKPAP